MTKTTQDRESSVSSRSSAVRMGRSTGERECLEVAAEKYTEETGEAYALP